jgi:hypothetical protein
MLLGHFKGNFSVGYGGIIAYSHYGMYWNGVKTVGV